MDWIRKKYIKYLMNMVNGGSEYASLFLYLFNTPFAIVIPRDANRVYDAIQLRYAFGDQIGMTEDDVESYFDNGECSVLELMVALANRCNQEIIYDENKGNQCAAIFWEMVKSLQLSEMTNSNFGERETEFALERFINRTYRSDGLGGLFHVPGYPKDMRDMEIWYQMMAYLNSLE